MQTLIAELESIVKTKIVAFLSNRPLTELVSLDYVQDLIVELARAVATCVTTAWKDSLMRLSEGLLDCPRCGRRRKRKWRAAHPLRVHLLGESIELPKLYLECEDCGASGSVSIIKLLTGLSSGEASAQLKLMAAYCASEQSYGASGRDLEVHHGQTLERTKLRRLALEIEKEAMEFAEAGRKRALQPIEGEARTDGVALLLIEGDGGKVRTGEPLPCKEGDPHYGERTPKRGFLRRKRPVSFREVITLDVREPQETEASALDALVPVLAKQGERSRRMLALAARKGLGDNTRVVGLGDMGSALAQSFDEAFFAYAGSWWNADWKHTCDYVAAAQKVFKRSFDGAAWAQAIKQALWKSDKASCDELLEQARTHRVKVLPRELEKCPVAALKTYLNNNWKHMHFAELKALELPFVSARAEAQVRDRTKDRFCVAGAWRIENLEPKATLRAIIADGRWQTFRNHVLALHRAQFEQNLIDRLRRAIEDRRLSQAQVSILGIDLEASCVSQQLAA